MTELPSVCVCVPSYNSEATIGDSLRSILSQTYRDLKVVLSDNASSDATVALARELASTDNRLKISVNSVNIGGENNYTRCIQLSEGELTAIYHADDVYQPDIVHESVAFFKAHPETGAVFTGAYEIDSAGNVIGRRDLPAGLCGGGPRSFAEVMREVLRRGNFMIFPSAMVRTSVYKDEVKAWNAAAYKTSADLDVWLRIAEKHPVAFINKPLMKYRVSPASYSYSYARLRTERQDLFLVLEAYVKKYSGSIIGQREMDDYRLLVLKDDISIAINHIIKGNSSQARARLGGVFNVSNIICSFRSKVQLKMLMYGWAAWLLSVLPLGTYGRALVAKVRHNG